MYHEEPEHCKIGINANGDGPVMEDDPDFVEYVCWCGVVDCHEYEG